MMGTVTRTCARGEGTPAVRLSSEPPRSQAAAASARSWVMVRSSSGPCNARAAAVARFQIPTAWSAGRYAESQAIPSRSGRYSSRRSATDLRWRFSMLTGWWRSRQVRAFCRNREGISSPAGHPRAGLGASGSRKCASSAAAPVGSRLVVSSTITRACCQEMVPSCNADRVNGKAVVSSRDSASSAPAVRSLIVRTQATSATTAISWAPSDITGDARAWAVAA